MASRPGIAPSTTEFETLQEAYGFSPIDGVEFPASN